MTKLKSKNVSAGIVTTISQVTYHTVAGCLNNGHEIQSKNNMVYTVLFVSNQIIRIESTQNIRKKDCTEI